MLNANISSFSTPSARKNRENLLCSPAMQTERGTDLFLTRQKNSHSVECASFSKC